MNDIVKRIRIELLEQQKEYVIKTLEKGELVEGDAKLELEERLKLLFNRKYVCLVSNGFAALFLSLKTVERGKNILTAPASTCFSIINAIITCDFNPCYVDMDLDFSSIGANSLLSCNENFNTAIIPNYYGLKSDIFKFQISPKFIIEDAAQSFSSSYRQKSVADITIVSLYPTKIINGIDGGVILTDNENVYNKVTKLSNYNNQFTYDPNPRYNFKLANIHAAYALGTLGVLEELENRLLSVYNSITEALDNERINYLKIKNNEVPTKLVIKCKFIKETESLMNYFSLHGIQTSKELMLVSPSDVYPNAKELINNTFSIPFHPFLKDSEVEKIINVLKVIKR